jgi:hypothetical protein
MPKAGIAYRLGSPNLVGRIAGANSFWVEQGRALPKATRQDAAVSCPANSPTPIRGYKESGLPKGA